MMLPSHITKEWLASRTNKEMSALFISGSNIHPNKRFYKYYWWIYSEESQEQSAKDIFFKNEKSLTTKQFLQKAAELSKRNIKFAYVNTKLHRLGNSVWDYEKIKTKYSDIEFAVAYEEDLEEQDN